ncbi:hypothetical protein HBI26_180750 [Parastagonospora nodorum]|nr:hypothetical protein HBI26_180750 [Parastagonospora nodorum]
MEAETLLNDALPSKVLVPSDEQYGMSNSAYFTVFESDLKPAFIAQPTTPAEVSRILQALNPLLEQQLISIAVRGTGHTPFAGSANIAGGVTVDMRGLKGIALSDDKSTVEIGVGEKWASIYTELEKHGLTTAGGRVGRVGVGGLVLGGRVACPFPLITVDNLAGGLSFYSTRKGFACDSVTEFEVVLASGDVVRANNEENHDLWIALRGGLNNFGIVTSVKMRTFEASKLWGGVAYYMPDTFSQLAEATVNFVNNESDEDTHIMSSAGYGYGHRVVTCCLYHTKGMENPPSLQPFTSLSGRIEQHGTLRTGTHMQFCDELSKFTQDGVRSFYATITVKPDVSLMKGIHDKWVEVLEALKGADGFIFSLGFFPMTKAMFVNSRDAGGNAKGIDPEDGPLLIMMLNPTWNSFADDERIHDGVERLLAMSRLMADEKGLLHRYVFTNYAYYKENVFKGYGEKSLAALRETSRKFDPKGIFQTAVPGGFKLASGSH